MKYSEILNKIISLRRLHTPQAEDKIIKLKQEAKKTFQRENGLFFASHKFYLDRLVPQEYIRITPSRKHYSNLCKKMDCFEDLNGTESVIVLHIFKIELNVNRLKWLLNQMRISYFLTDSWLSPGRIAVVCSRRGYPISLPSFTEHKKTLGYFQSVDEVKSLCEVM